VGKGILLCGIKIALNYLALKISPEECANETVLHPNAEFLGMGELLELV